MSSDLHRRRPADLKPVDCHCVAERGSGDVSTREDSVSSRSTNASVNEKKRSSRCVAEDVPTDANGDDDEDVTRSTNRTCSARTDSSSMHGSEDSVGEGRE